MRTLFIAFLLFFSVGAFAQRTEVNPNIKWSFVRSQEINFQSGRTYQFEFPAEKGYDYIFNLTHNIAGAFASISVFDMQYEPVAALTDSANNETIDLSFRAKSNGTYIVVLALSADAQDAILPTTLSLVRRPIVRY